jgi:hypothetical protein
MLFFRFTNAMLKTAFQKPQCNELTLLGVSRAAKDCKEYALHSACTLRIAGFRHALTRPVTQTHALTVDVFWYLVKSTCIGYSSTVFLQQCMVPFVSGVSLPPATRQVNSPHITFQSL